MLHYYNFSYYLRQGLMYRRIPNPLASTYRVLRLQEYITIPCACDARDCTHPLQPSSLQLLSSTLPRYVPSPHHFILQSWSIGMLISTLVWSLGFLPKAPGHLYAELFITMIALDTFFCLICLVLSKTMTLDCSGGSRWPCL